MSTPTKLPDAWLRGPVEGVPRELLPAAHAFIQTMEEVRRWADELPAGALWTAPGEAATAGFHVRHLAGSTRRLMGYARGEPLTEAGRAALLREREVPDAEAQGERDALVADALAALEEAMAALRATPVASLYDDREVGRDRLPASVIGAIFHAAEHAQRHAGQLATTVKALRGSAVQTS